MRMTAATSPTPTGRSRPDDLVGLAAEAVIRYCPVPARCVLRTLRGATARVDRAAVQELLTGTDPTLLLQYAEPALLAVGTDGLEDVARDVVERLTARGDGGDAVLALALAARLGGPEPLLRPLRTDLEQVADLLAGDPCTARTATST